MTNLTMSDYPDLCNDEPSCCKPELEEEIRTLTAERDALQARVDELKDALRNIVAEARGAAKYHSVRWTAMKALKESSDE